MSLAKLKAGALRRGRGNTTDEQRQLHDESLGRDELLQAAIVELCGVVERLEIRIDVDIAALDVRVTFLESLHP